MLMVPAGTILHTAAVFTDGIPDFVAAAFIFLLAGAVKGLLGMGLPTVAMALLGLVMPVTQAAVLIGVPSLVTNGWQALYGPHLRQLLVRFWPLQLGIAIGVSLGWRFMDPRHQDTASLLLGACLVAYGVMGLLGTRLPRPARSRERPLSCVMGVLTGLVTSATGVFVLPAVPFLQSLELEKDEMAQALGLSFLTSTVALGFLLWVAGQMRTSGIAQSMLMVLPALVGMWIGQQLRDELSQVAFRRALFAGLAVLGGWLVLRQLAA